jgi:SSS family transporter
MLITFVVLYLIASVGIGLWAATRVHNTRDFVVAGRTLPLYVVAAMVFATWFGSETVLGIPARFAEEGLRGVVEDPFGSSMCLILVGLFFAARLYRMDLLTIGDFYRQRYNRAVEVISSLAIIASYLGWVSAQVVALGLVFNVLTGGGMSLEQGIVIGAAIVLLYTFFGGMFSVAWTNFFQMVIIIGGLLYIAWVVGEKAGGLAAVAGHAAQAGKFEFWPALEPKELLAFVAAWVTMMFGSIPQQDVFQRVTSARTEKIAIAGSVLGGAFYFLFAFVPIFLAYSAFLIDPAMVGELIEKDPQHVLPTLVMNHTPLAAQIVFFGALLSAIMSTAAATLLAPSVTFTENILKGMLARELTDRQFLWTMRAVVAVFAAGVALFALNSQSSIYEMVGNAYKVTLVAAFIPLVCGLYWRRATTQGALFSIFLGLSTWLSLEFFNPEGLWPPQLAGLLAAAAGMLIGSLAPQRVARHDLPHPHLHHHRHPARQHTPNS